MNNPLPEQPWGTAVLAWVTNTVALLMAFGLPLDSTQQAAILAWVGSTTVLASAYMVGHAVKHR